MDIGFFGRNGNMKRVVIAMIAAMMILASGTSAFAAGGSKTTIKGVQTRYSKTYTKTLKDTIKVSPAYGRQVTLSVYNPYQKRWEVKATYRTPNKKTARITITYPGVWKAYGSSAWRVSAPAATVKVKANGARKSLKGKSVNVSIKDKLTKGKAAVVMDARSGQCVYADNAIARRKIASMTKMMTMILLAEHKGLNDRVAINHEATAARKMSGGMGLKEGDVVTVKDLMYCAMLPSANDAAAASAVAVSGSQEAFKNLMRNKAVAIGAADSTYKYAFGDWYGNALSTAFDQALIGREFMTNPKTEFLRQVAKTKNYSFTTKKKKIKYSVTYNYAGNLILGQLGSIGIKTGYNPPAGRCFTNAWYYKGRLYISVIMGEPSANQLWKDVKKLTQVSNYLVDTNAGKVLVKQVPAK